MKRIDAQCLIPKKNWLENGLFRHTLPEPEGVLRCDTVWDVGAGLRPMNWYEPKRHICVEPHLTYAKKLQDAGYQVVKKTAQEFARTAITEDKYLEQVVILDVIEHLTRPEAEQVIHDLAFQVHRQLILYTPLGLTSQEGLGGGDGWGYDGQKWQEHKCGFLPIDDIFVRNGFDTSQKYGKGFFAILTR